MKYKYTILLLIATIVLSSCQNFDNPIENPIYKAIVKTEYKYEVDINNSNNSVLLYHKEFDPNGNLVLHNQFNSSGILQAVSHFRYEDKLSIEEKTIFDESGNLLQTSNFVYTYDDNGRVTEKKSLDYNGAVSLSEIYNYDGRGNLLGKISKNMQTGAQNFTEYTYKYKSDGSLVERITNESGLLGNITSRDSISHIQQDNKLEVFRYNSAGNILSIKSIYYNQVGNIYMETESDAQGNLKNKFAYRYEYHK